jgi:superfamily II DNA helicase RecQ
VPAYLILNQRTLLSIADAAPATREELLGVPGFGANKWKQFGPELLQLIAEHRKS